jgi:hypothetical protein
MLLSDAVAEVRDRALEAAPWLTGTYLEGGELWPNQGIGADDVQISNRTVALRLVWLETALRVVWAAETAEYSKSRCGVLRLVSKPDEIEDADGRAAAMPEGASSGTQQRWGTSTARAECLAAACYADAKGDMELSAKVTTVIGSVRK